MPTNLMQHSYGKNGSLNLLDLAFKKFVCVCHNKKKLSFASSSMIQSSLHSHFQHGVKRQAAILHITYRLMHAYVYVCVSSIKRSFLLACLLLFDSMSVVIHMILRFMCLCVCVRRAKMCVCNRRRRIYPLC